MGRQPFRIVCFVIATLALVENVRDFPCAKADSAVSVLQGTVASAAKYISGAAVTIFAVESEGASPVGSGTTDSNGNFSISFSNLGGAAVLYVVTRGGNLGQGNNAAIAMLAVLGTEENFANSFTINEVTTVASVWSMAQFIHPDGSIFGSSPGLQNGAATLASLSNLETGQLSETLKGVYSSNEPYKVTSLANLLAGCIDSNGPSSDACTSLFKASTPRKQTSPIDTLAAAVNIAQHPTLNAEDLYSLSMKARPTALDLLLLLRLGLFL